MLLLLVIVDMTMGLLVEDERELSELRPCAKAEVRKSGRIGELCCFHISWRPALSSNPNHVDYMKNATS